MNKGNREYTFFGKNASDGKFHYAYVYAKNMRTAVRIFHGVPREIGVMSWFVRCGGPSDRLNTVYPVTAERWGNAYYGKED